MNVPISVLVNIGDREITIYTVLTLFEIPKKNVGVLSMISSIYNLQSYLCIKMDESEGKTNSTITSKMDILSSSSG